VIDPVTSREEIVRPARHLFVSPHYDDIALSCGGTAALVAQQRREPVVALLFGSEPSPDEPLTAFAEQLHRQWGMAADEVIAGRRREETAASAILGTRDSFAPFQDAIYRGDQYTSDAQLFGSPAAGDADLPAAIIESLDLNGSPDRDTRVYVPLAVGNHVDHQIAFAAGVELAKRGWEVWFYEDLPYGLRQGARQDRIVGSGQALVVAAVVDVEKVWDSKIAAIMSYPSQLAVIFSYVASGHSRNEIDATMLAYARDAGGGIPSERFWKSDS
jgi:LmbE family N-acetylglucosaminyl deacetylase